MSTENPQPEQQPPQPAPPAAEPAPPNAQADVPQQEPDVPSIALGTSSIESTSDDRTMALVCHLLGGLVGFLVPLIVWLIKKDQSKFVDDQGKEALNFQITILLGHLILVPVMCIPFAGLIAIPGHLALRVLSIVFGIVAGTTAQKGVVYRYPVAIRFIS